MPDTNPRRPAGSSRRTFLLTAAAAAGALAAGCARATGSAPAVRVPLADLDAGGGRTVTVQGRPVHVRRIGGEVVALSLLCTHMGCAVTWDEARALYVCPCHDGRFAADGTTVAGPPPRPLDRVAVRVEGSEALVG